MNQEIVPVITQTTTPEAWIFDLQASAVEALTRNLYGKLVSDEIRRATYSGTAVFLKQEAREAASFKSFIEELGFPITKIASSLRGHTPLPGYRHTWRTNSK